MDVRSRKGCFYGTIAITGGIEEVFSAHRALINSLIRGDCHMVWHRRMRARCAYADSRALRVVPFFSVDVARHFIPRYSYLKPMTPFLGSRRWAAGRAWPLRTRRAS